MRAVDYIGVAVKDIKRQLVRSLLTVTALVISTVILVTLAAISNGGQQAITNQFGQASLKTVSITPNQGSSSLSPFGGIQEVNGGAAKLTDETVGRLAGIPKVLSVSPRVGLWEFRSFSVEGSPRQFVAQASGAPFDSAPTVIAGRNFSSNDEYGSVIIGARYASELGFAPRDIVGKKISITTQKGYRGQGAAIPPANASQQTNDTFNQTETILSATIVGVTDEKLEQNGLFTSLGWARQIRTAQYAEPTGIKKVDQLNESGYTLLRLRANDVSDIPAVTSTVRAMGYGATTPLEQLGQFQQFTSIMWVILGAVDFIAAIAAALGVANTMLMTISEQQYIIGIWRAVGARKVMIVRMILTQASVLGFAGGIIGVVLGYLTTVGVDRYVVGLLEAQGLGLVSFLPLPWWLMVGGVALTTLFALLASFYPAYKAANLDPSAALTNGR